MSSPYDPQITAISHAIRDGSCVVILGPNLIFDRTEIHEILKQKLAAAGYPDIAMDADELVYLKDSTQRSVYAGQLREYMQVSAMPDLISKLARLPLSLIVTLSPDRIIAAAFKALGLPVQEQYYNHKRNPGPLPLFDAEHPMIYNLFGREDKPESLILTSRDLVDFIFDVVGKHTLPRELDDLLSSEYRMFLFLGFDFSKWYMRLLFRLLHLDESDSTGFGPAALQLDDTLRNYYAQHYNLSLIGLDADQLVDQLLDRCGDCLRTSGAEMRPLGTQLRDKVEEDDLGGAFELLRVNGSRIRTRDAELHDLCIMQAGNWEKLRRDEHANLLSQADADLQRSKIKAALLYIATQLDALL
ncbi:MAG: SIR2 family protein [Bacteroidia bacterium]|nr:SIR2 family protein [Bacteroidia bacterium]